MLHKSGNFHIILCKTHNGEFSPGDLDSPGLCAHHDFFTAGMNNAPMIFDAEKTIALQGENRYSKEEISWKLKAFYHTPGLWLFMRFRIGLLAFHSKLYENTAGPIPPLLMVGLVVDDAIAPVNLLHQNHTHQLVGKGHPGKTKLFIRPL